MKGKFAPAAALLSVAIVAAPAFGQGTLAEALAAAVVPA